MTRSEKLAIAVSAALGAAGLVGTARAQTTIYQEQWGSGIGSLYTTTATSPTSGAQVLSGQLVLQNNFNAGTIVSGHVRVTTPTSGGAGVSYYDPSFSTTLDANGDGNQLIWDINIQQNRNNPSGFGLSNTAAAYVLGATNADFLNQGSGYAVVIGSTSTDPLMLVRYDPTDPTGAAPNGGMAQIGLNARNFALIQSGANANTNYQSVRIVYRPADNSWRMYARDDGASAFTDAIATPVPDSAIIGIAKEETPIAGALSSSGYLWTHFTTAGNNAKFDNVRLTRDLAPNIPARNFQWDSDGTGPATDGAGNWATNNNWIDTADNTTHGNWDNNRPDNAIFGTGGGTGTGSAAVSVGTTTQFGGLLTFNANSPTYTITAGTGGTVTLFGADDLGTNKSIIAHQSAQVNARLNVAAASVVQVDSGATLTVGDGTTNGGLGGAGQITKTGTGTMSIISPANNRSGHITVQEGELLLPLSSLSGGLPGTGTGNIFSKNTGTLHIDATGATSTTQYTISTGPIIHMGDGGTLRITGNVTYQRNYPQFKRGTQALPQDSHIFVDANSQFTYRAQIRNDGQTTNNYHTIHLDGPGIVKLTNAGSNAGGDSNLYGGSWEVNNGILWLGQNTETGGSNGDTLNDLGFKDGNPAMGNTVTLNGTGTLVGTEDTPNIPAPGTVVDWYRANVVLNGGSLASGNGKDTKWGGNLTVQSPSKILTYDPLNPTVPRNVSLVRGTADTFGGIWMQGDTTWGGNLTVDPGATTGGKLVISRDGGTISVTPGATITVNQGSTLELGGTADALNDGTNQVNIVNNSTNTLRVVSGTKNVGTVSGNGNTTVLGGATLTAKYIRQNGLDVQDGGRANVRARTGGPPTANNNNVSVVNTLSLNSSGTLDLNDNDLVVNNGSYTTIRDARNTGYTNGPAGPGIVSSTASPNNYLALFDNSLLVNPLTAWKGLTVASTAIIGKYTYSGDVNIDGQVTGDDYTVIDSNLGSTPPVGLEWIRGDANRDGSVTGDDYTVIDSNLGSGVGDPLGSALVPSSLSAVPEPGSLSVLSAAGAGLLMRRRRSR